MAHILGPRNLADGILHVNLWFLEFYESTLLMIYFVFV